MEDERAEVIKGLERMHKQVTYPAFAEYNQPMLERAIRMLKELGDCSTCDWYVPDYIFEDEKDYTTQTTLKEGD